MERTTTDEVVMDLDESSVLQVHHRPLAGRLLAPRIGVPQFVAALLAGVVVAATATHTIESRRQQASDNAHVALTTLVGTAESGGRNDRTVNLEATLTVVNTGPTAVVLERVTGTTDGLTFRSNGSRTVQPGVKQVAVAVTMDCVKGIPIEPLKTVMNVETADGQPREASSLMVIQGTPWAQVFEGMCHSFIFPGG